MKTVKWVYYIKSWFIRERHEKQFAAAALLILVLSITYISTICLIHFRETRLKDVKDELKNMSETISLIDHLNMREEYLIKKLSSLNKLSKSEVVWYPVVESIMECIPENIILESLNANQNDINLKIAANDPKSIIDCISSLESYPNIESINNVEIYPDGDGKAFTASLYIKPYGFGKRGG